MGLTNAPDVLLRERKPAYKTTTHYAKEYPNLDTLREHLHIKQLSIRTLKLPLHYRNVYFTSPLGPSSSLKISTC